MTTDSRRGRGIVACIAATTTVTVTLGLSWPLLAIVLERQGVPTWLNGLSASAQMLAVLAIAALAPRLIGSLGTIRVMVLGIIGIAIALVLLPAFPNVWAWFPIRFFLGLSAELVFTGGDIWINQLASDRTRGRLIGVYGMFLHGGFAVGPVAIAVLGSEDWTALYFGVVVILLGLLPLSRAGGAAPRIEGKPRARMLHFFRIAPTLMLAGLMFGLIDSTLFAVLPVYGIERGLGPETAALLLTMLVLGAVMGQLPVGWLADHMDRRWLMAGCAFVTMVAIAALPLVIGNGLLTWAAMLLMGMSLGSVYLVGMTMIGQRFEGADLVGINASFVFLWGLGMVLGPSLGGAAMDLFGPEGMPVMAVVFCVLFLGVILGRIRARAEP